MVSITVGQFISDVAEELEVVDSGGTLTTNEQASMIRRLQRLIDGSNIQRPLIFAERLDLLTLTPDQQTYTIGIDPTGTSVAAFPVPRPTQINRANLLLSPTVRLPMDVLTFKQWAAIRYQQIDSPPRGVYFDNGFGGGFVGSGTLNTTGIAVSGATGTAFSAQLVGQTITIAGAAYPVIAVASGTALTLASSAGSLSGAIWSAGALSGFGTLYFYPIPDQAYQWEMYSMWQNANIVATTDLLNYPPGYADYWLYSMVVRCASMFGRQPTEAHLLLLQKATEAIMGPNCMSPEIRTDRALVSGDNGLYNWLSGTTDEN